MAVDFISVKVYASCLAYGLATARAAHAAPPPGRRMGRRRARTRAPAHPTAPATGATHTTTPLTGVHIAQHTFSR